jgi:hypothetical protein
MKLGRGQASELWCSHEKSPDLASLIRGNRFTPVFSGKCRIENLRDWQTNFRPVPEVILRMPAPSMDLPMHLTFNFEIQQGDLVYVGSCRRQDYKSEWQVGQDVQFRLSKDKLYLRRPNGKEMSLVFLLQAKVGPDGKPMTILQYKKK